MHDNDKQFPTTGGAGHVPKSTHVGSRWGKAATLSVAIAMTGAGISLAVASGASATPPSGGNVTICHATSSATNPYVTETVALSSLTGSGHGNSGVNPGDIIPPTPNTDFPNGNNWGTISGLSATGEQIWNNGCNIPTDQTSSSSSSTSASATESSSASETESSSAPATDTTSASATNTAPAVSGSTHGVGVCSSETPEGYTTVEIVSNYTGLTTGDNITVELDADNPRRSVQVQGTVDAKGDLNIDADASSGALNPITPGTYQLTVFDTTTGQLVLSGSATVYDGACSSTSPGQPQGSGTVGLVCSSLQGGKYYQVNIDGAWSALMSDTNYTLALEQGGAVANAPGKTDAQGNLVINGTFYELLAQKGFVPGEAALYIVQQGQDKPAFQEQVNIPEPDCAPASSSTSPPSHEQGTVNRTATCNANGTYTVNVSVKGLVSSKNNNPNGYWQGGVFVTNGVNTVYSQSQTNANGDATFPPFTFDAKGQSSVRFFVNSTTSSGGVDVPFTVDFTKCTPSNSKSKSPIPVVSSSIAPATSIGPFVTPVANNYPVQSPTSGHGVSFWDRPMTLLGLLAMLLGIALAMFPHERFKFARRSH